MIVKIWPVKGAQGMKNAMLYIQDDNKVIKVEQDEHGRVLKRKIIELESGFQKDADSFFIENEEDIGRVFSYMANEDKIKSKYISGYLCSPETAMENFRDTWAQIPIQCGIEKKPQNMKRENMAFHLVQSFPEDLEISDEEVHQCGLELLQRIGKHQGIVCSHVHPVMDEEGEVHGLCKHNHILFNAFIQPDKIDPEHPKRVKYHDCKETYAQLQIWNDEIAIEHGLPIIRNPDPDRVYSWKESYEAKRGGSWKDRIRLDIETARSLTNTWEEFKAFMEQTGYQIREGVHTTYMAPDGEHRIRGKILGQQYTKENLELYWAIRSRIERSVEKAVKENAAPPLWTVAQRYGRLIVNVPVGLKNDDTRPSYPLPLDKADRTREVLNTYFNDKDIYDVQDENGHVVVAATGQELVDYLDALRRGEQERWNENDQQRTDEQDVSKWQQEEERRRQREQDNQKKNQYTYRFRNSRTKRYYHTDLWDEDGRRRSSLELIFMLAIVVIKNEDGLWDYKGKAPGDKENEAVLGHTDWKVKNMMESIQLASEEGIESPAQLDQKLNETGAAFSRARSALQKTKRAREKMEALDKALDEYDDTKELAERILALPDGEEKGKMQDMYRTEIERFKKAKAVMYGYRITSQEDIDDFRNRYADIENNLPDMQEKFDRTKEEYRRLKKLQHNMRLAQSEEYCYGPEYPLESVLSDEEKDYKEDRDIIEIEDSQQRQEK